MMGGRVRPKYLWFRLTIIFGVLLGVLLLAQTILTYRHVSYGLLRQEAQREIDERVDSIGRSARLTGLRDSSKLAPTLRDLVHEAPLQIAWIRILNLQGEVVAESEPVREAPKYAAGEVGRLAGGRVPRIQQQTTASGPVLISLRPLRFGPPPFGRPPNEPAERGGPPRFGRGQRPAPEFVETAVYLNGISANFGLLREYLVVGCLAACALMAAVIVIGVRFPHYMRGKKVEEELSLARRVQLDLFPAEDTISGGLPFAAKCVPAWQVGGDLYDVFETDDGEVGMILGDVSGKGLAAALLMGVVQGAIRSSTGVDSAANHEHAAERLNQLLCMKTARERFVSLFWCYFDRNASVLRYINAGHLPPLLIRKGEGGAAEIRRLVDGGPVLGLLPGARYTQAKVDVRPGDLLVVYSDGILEAENAAGDEFGEDGVIATVNRRMESQPGEICGAVLDEVRKFLGPSAPQDDQTLLIARLTPLERGVEPLRAAASQKA